MHASERLKEEQVEMKTLEQVPLRDPTFSPWKTIKSSLIFALMAILPALFVAQLSNYRVYDIVENRGYQGLDQIMEFWRWSVFIVYASLAYMVITTSVELVPGMVVYFAEKGTKSPSSVYWRRQNFIIRNAKFPISMALFFLALVFISSRILYHSSFLELVSPVVKERNPQELRAYLAERSFVFLLIFFSLWAISQYIAQFIAYHFHQTAFASRIYDFNYKFEAINRLYTYFCRGMQQPTKAERATTATKNVLETTLANDTLDLSSPTRSNEIAIEIFSNICPANRDHIRREDLRIVFDDSELSAIFLIFDEYESGKMTRNDLAKTILSIHEERQNLVTSLKCNSRIIKKLASVFSMLALVFAFLLGVTLFKLQTMTIIAIFGAVYMGFNFAVQSGVGQLYTAINFIFVEHAYDVGDRVIIGGNNLLVKEIELYTTVFTKWDGTAVYMTNGNLSGMTVYNIRRSGNSSELIEQTLPTDISMDRIWEIKDKLVEFVKSRPQDFTPNLDIASINVVDSKITKVVFVIEYKGNFQNLAQKTSRRNRLDEEIKMVRRELELPEA